MREKSEPPSVSVRIIKDVQNWDSIQDHWNDLFNKSPYAATPLRFAWLRTWWHHYGPSYAAENRGLHIITVWRDEQLIGALPLYGSNLHVSFLGVRRIGFLSTGEMLDEETCPDYMNILCLPGEEAACLPPIQDALRGAAWDFLEFSHVPEHSPLLKDHSWCEGPWEIVATEGCPVANIEGGFEAYLARLNSKHRKNNRRVLRSVEESGATLEIATPETAEPFFDDLVRIHQERWNSVGKPGCFSATRFHNFHREVALRSIPTGEAVLARLRLGDKTLAAVYGFITGKKFDVYQSGVDVAEKTAVHSPGVAAHLLLMDQLSQRNLNAYDFLRGASQYKNGLATDKSLLFTIRAWRNTVRALAHKSCQFFGVTMKPDPTPDSSVAKTA